MRIFMTGGAGFVGAATARALLKEGHSVLGLARSEASAGVLTAMGAAVLRGSVGAPDSLERGVAQADGVIHTAFNHDFSTYKQNCEDDRAVIAGLASALAGSDRPLIVTSGLGGVPKAPGAELTEEDPPLGSDVMPRAASEEAVAAAVEMGVNVSVVRLPQVHDTKRQGLVSMLIEIFRRTGQAVYVGSGDNEWAAGHVDDVARLYKRAVEAARPGAVYHGVGEAGVRLRDIVETVGAGLNLPVRSLTREEAEPVLGWMTGFASMSQRASSRRTQAELGWRPTGPGLLADLQAFAEAASRA